MGITRAQSRLFLTAARRRLLFGQPQALLLSRFLDEIPAKLLKTERAVEKKPAAKKKQLRLF